MTTKLVGRDDTTLNVANGSSYIVMTKWQAANSGRVTEFRFRCAASVSGNVVIGLYSDNSGAPDTLLGTTDSTAVSSGSEREVTVAASSSFTVVAGTWYWIAFNSSNAFVGAKVQTGTRRYKSATYGALPSSAGTGYSSDTVYTDITSAYGNTPQTVTPSGRASTLACGSPVVALASTSQTVTPSAIASALAIGTPAIIIRRLIYPTAVASGLAFGSPIIYQGKLTPSAIASALAFGSPSLIRPLPHFILAASYAEDTPSSNFFYIIGRDTTGGYCSGSAQDSTEPALVGSRLDVIHDGAVSSSADAAAAAAARVARARLEKRRAGITIAPHCGLELWDVVSITDSLGNQSARFYRVVSYRLEYDMKKSIYRHTIELSAV